MPKKVRKSEMAIQKETKITIRLKQPRLIDRIALEGSLKNATVSIEDIKGSKLIIGDKVNTKKNRKTKSEGFDSGNFSPIMTDKIVIEAKKATVSNAVLIGL